MMLRQLSVSQTIFKRPILKAFLVVLLCGQVLSLYGEPSLPSLESLAHKTRWICFYGKNVPLSTWKTLDLAILDPDNFQLSSPKYKSQPHPIRIGYLSVGEAEENRWYWSLVAGKEFIIGANPNWEGNHYVDIRDPEWQSLLLHEVIPDILNKGYDGLFLDTLDTAFHLEDRDPRKFKGSKIALTRFIKKIRRQYPSASLISNNALPLLDEWVELIDGAFVEDLYTGYDFKASRYIPIEKSISQEKEKHLLQYQQKSNRPVFVIHYTDNPKETRITEALNTSDNHGFLSYISTLSLMEIGGIAP